MAKQRVLLLGAHGETGGTILGGLLEDENFVSRRVSSTVYLNVQMMMYLIISYTSIYMINMRLLDFLRIILGAVFYIYTKKECKIIISHSFLLNLFI